MGSRWTTSDRRWLALQPHQRAALMSLMEVNNPKDSDGARNILGAMVNRAKKEGADLGEHVGRRIYQPSFEPSQRARLGNLMKSPNFGELSKWADERWNGRIGDNVSGATHYLAPERVMLNLEAKNPSKYKNWGPNGANWTGYGKDPAKPNEYKGVVLRDRSHAFLAPEGAYSAPGQGPFMAMNNGGGDPQTDGIASPAMVSGAGRTAPGGPPPQSISPGTGMASAGSIFKRPDDIGAYGGRPQSVSGPQSVAEAPSSQSIPELPSPQPSILTTDAGRESLSSRMADDLPNTTQPSLIDGPTGGPFELASGGSFDLPSAPDASAGAAGGDFGDIFGSLLGGLGKGGEDKQKPVDTSALTAAVQAEEERRKKFALSPFQLSRMV